MNRSRMIWGVGALVALPVVAFVSWIGLGYLYSYSENQNFEKLRQKSELDCAKMPLHCAVRDDDFEALAAYVTAGRDLELKDRWGRSALSWATQFKKRSMVAALLTAGANPEDRNEDGDTPFYWAVTHEAYDLADALLAAGADVNTWNRAKDPHMALHDCVMSNRKGCVDYLLRRGADPSLKDSYGYTALERVELYDWIDNDISELLRKWTASPP